MSELATTRMSSKGQIVIPENIRKQMNLKEGTQFVVVGEKDMVMLKTIAEPSISEFDELIQQARAKAKKVRLQRSDVAAAIKKVRGSS
jgi:AbrB family looped-hinge helix DNA binding protein